MYILIGENNDDRVRARAGEDHDIVHLAWISSIGRKIVVRENAKERRSSRLRFEDNYQELFSL